MAAASWAARAAGKGTPAFGGCDESFRARTTRPTFVAAWMSSSQFFVSSSWRFARAVFIASTRVRVLSSRAMTGSFEATTIARRSRRSISAMMRWAPSALSSHSATRRRGSSCSAICTRPSAGIFSWPAATAALFCCSTAARTAGTPPDSTFSAMARCASGRSFRTASTCARPARRRLAFGRMGSSGGVSKWGRRGRCGRSDFSPSLLAGRSLRGPRFPSSRRSLRASFCVTGSNGLSLGRISSRPVRAVFCLVGRIESTRVPSRSVSTSARRTSFTDAPEGTTEDSTTPFGSRAPAARHVQVPSSRLLVSSISMRRDIGAIRYLFGSPVTLPTWPWLLRFGHADLCPR